MNIAAFPTYEKIIQHLVQHPKTSEPHLPNMKIIIKVASFFANQPQDSHQITIGVLQCLSDLNDDLKLPVCDFIKTQALFVQALQDYGKKIEHPISKL